MTLLRLLRALLLPPGFRAEYGEEMDRAVRARLGERPSGWPRVRLLGREAMDVARTGAREWGHFFAELVGRRATTGRGDGTMAAWVRDIRYALRTLGRAPAFAAVVVLTLAAGIGANTAIFSVVDAVLLEQLPYEEPEELVSVWQDVTRRGGPVREWFSYTGFEDVRDEPGVFDAAAVWGDGFQPTLLGAGEPIVLVGGTVGHAFFTDVLRVRPVLGRLFLPEDDVDGAPGVVVLSWETWQGRFEADPDIVGRTLNLSEATYTVVGVLPEGFESPVVRGAELWRALGPTNALRCDRGCFGWRVIARLADETSLEGARARLDALASRLEEEYPESNTDLRFAVFGLREDMTQGGAAGLWVVMGAVAFVLLVACTNVANLVLARGASRAGELGVRTALGAGRAAIVRQLLAESFVLAAAGGVLGVILAFWGVDLLVGLAPDGVLPRLESVSLDLRVLLFTAGVTAFTGLLFGLVPAVRASRTDVHDTLRATGRGGTGSGRGLRDMLAVAQVALALVLLVGAGLMARSYQRLHDAPLGFEPEGVITLQVRLPFQRYRDFDDRRAFYDELLRRVRAVPGVESAGAGGALPLAGGDGDITFRVEGQPPPDVGVPQAAWIRPVTAGFFETLGMTLEEGRLFGDGDHGDAPRVVIVNRTLADRYLGDAPLGARVGPGSQPDEEDFMTVVGVAGDTRHFGIRGDARPAVYLPYAQFPQTAMFVTARTDREPSDIVPALRRTVGEVDPALAAANIQTLEGLVDTALAPDRFVTLLLSVFALAALALATIGIYGVISYGVSQRVREMGIRRALGADGAQVRRLVVRGGLALVAGGVAVGLVGALAGARLLRSLLYEVGENDPTTLAATTLLLVLVAFVAAWLPAARAARTDPARVLRDG